jgi:hypothetical protein
MPTNYLGVHHDPFIVCDFSPSSNITGYVSVQWYNYECAGLYHLSYTYRHISLLVTSVPHTMALMMEIMGLEIKEVNRHLQWTY